MNHPQTIEVQTVACVTLTAWGVLDDKLLQAVLPLLSSNAADQPSSYCAPLLQAHSLHAQELQIQAWGGTAAAMEAAALMILDIDHDFITVSIRADNALHLRYL